MRPDDLLSGDDLEDLLHASRAQATDARRQISAANAVIETAARERSGLKRDPAFDVSIAGLVERRDLSVKNLEWLDGFNAQLEALIHHRSTAGRPQDRRAELMTTTSRRALQTVGP